MWGLFSFQRQRGRIHLGISSVERDTIAGRPRQNSDALTISPSPVASSEACFCLFLATIVGHFVLLDGELQSQDPRALRTVIYESFNTNNANALGTNIVQTLSIVEFSLGGG
jgi:hypothetical protein